jgi:hypothetical protein
MIYWPDLSFGPVNLWNCPTQFWRETAALTEKDVMDKLKELPEIDILEILDISAEELVDRFQDKIEERRDYFEEDL